MSEQIHISKENNVLHINEVVAPATEACPQPDTWLKIRAQENKWGFKVEEEILRNANTPKI